MTKEPRLAKSIIFTKTPLKSSFRYKDKFQIYPCTFSEAPKSIYSQDFPVVIEYYIEEEDINVKGDLYEMRKFIEDLTPQMNTLSRIIKILTSITNHKFFKTDGENGWALVFPETEITEDNREEIDKQPSKWTMSMYAYPSISKDLDGKEFSTPDIPFVTLKPHINYYVEDPIDDKTKEIIFPDTINYILDKYYSCDLPTKKIIDSVCHLIYYGVELKVKMKSLSFLSFISSIETLVNYEFKSQNKEIKFECSDCQSLATSTIHCAKCGKPIWGVKAKFKAFLQGYVSNGIASTIKYNRIYNLRSEIIHNGMLLIGDGYIEWGDSEKEKRQWHTHIETMQMARLSLVNYLLKGPNKSIKSDYRIVKLPVQK